MNVYVTGIGAVTAIGQNVSENLHALKNQMHGIAKKQYPHLNKEVYVAEVKQSNQALADACQFENSEVSRTSLLGLKAAKECWGNNTLDSVLKTGLISGTSVGGMDVSERVYRAYKQENKIDFRDMKYHDSGFCTEIIAKELGISDYVNTISTACSSGANAIMLGARLIQAGKLDRVIVGGVDALTEFTINGFGSLMIYSDALCLPFDKARTGLNLGEGAGFLLLESEACQQKTNNPILGSISGWGNTADAYHQTATSPDAKGAIMAMENALEKAGLSPENIDYVNAHGTATENNDETEAIALTSVFGKQVPPFSSTKSYTGHTLAASGAIEAVYAILSFQSGMLFPNLRFQDPIAASALIPVTSVLEHENLQHIQSNSFGFGGNCTSLIISKK